MEPTDVTQEILRKIQFDLSEPRNETRARFDQIDGRFDPGIDPETGALLVPFAVEYVPAASHRPTHRARRAPGACSRCARPRASCRGAGVFAVARRVSVGTRATKTRSGLVALGAAIFGAPQAVDASEDLQLSSASRRRVVGARCAGRSACAGAVPAPFEHPLSRKTFAPLGALDVDAHVA